MKLDQTLRLPSIVVAAGIGVAVCEARRRKGTLLGGTGHRGSLRDRMGGSK